MGLPFNRYGRQSDRGGFVFLFGSSTGSGGGGGPVVDPLIFNYTFYTSASMAAAPVRTTRTGTGIYCQLNISSSSPALGNDTNLWEDWGDGMAGGIWAFDSISGLIASPFDLTASAVWTHDPGLTYTANAGIAPDGTQTADRIRDNSTTAPARVYRAITGASAVHRVWARAVAGDVPDAAGGLGVNLNFSQTASFAPLTTEWRVYRTRGTGSSHHALSIAGGLSSASVGAMEFWGAQSTSTNVNGRYPYLPLIADTSATGQPVVQLTSSVDLAKLVISGVLDIEVGFIPGMTTLQSANGLLDQQHVFSLSSSNGGTVGLKFRRSPTGCFVDIGGHHCVTSSLFSAPNRWVNYDDGDEVVLRLYVSGSTARIRQRNNGCVVYDAEAVGSGSWTLPSSFDSLYLGSATGSASTSIKGRITSVRTYSNHGDMTSSYSAPGPGSVHGLIIGDSLMATFTNGLVTVGSTVMSASEARATGSYIASLAVGGNQVSQQLSVYNNCPYKGSSNVRWVIIAIGINDVNAGTTIANLTASYQNLVNTVKAGNPSARVYGMRLLPADGVLTTAEQHVWLQFNSCLDGIPTASANAITGLDGVITEYSNRMNVNNGIGPAGTNLYKPEFDFGDALHQNNLARHEGGNVFRSFLMSQGVWDAP